MFLLSQIPLQVIWHSHHHRVTPFNSPFATAGAVHPSGDGSKSYIITLGDTESSSRMGRGAQISFTQIESKLALYTLESDRLSLTASPPLLQRYLYPCHSINFSLIAIRHSCPFISPLLVSLHFTQPVLT